MKMANVFANPILVGMTTEGDIHVPTRRSFPFSRCAITRLLLEILDDLYGCMVCILFVLFSLEFLQCYDVLCFFFLFSDTFECRSTGACTECVNVAFRWRRIKHFLYLTMTSLALILMKQILKMILRNSDRSAIAVWITASPFLTWDPRFREVGNPPAVSRTAPLQRSAVKNQRVFCLWAAARCIHSTATPAVPSKSKQQTLKINRDQDKAIDIPEKISFGCITENTFGCDLAASENEAWLKMADVDSDSEGRLDRAEPNCYSLRLLVDLHKTSPLHTRWLYRTYSVMSANSFHWMLLTCPDADMAELFYPEQRRCLRLVSFLGDLFSKHLFPWGSSGWSSVYWGAFRDQNFKLSRWDMESEHLLGGGFKDFLFSPLFGEASHLD